MIKKLIFILSHDLMFVIQSIMYVLKTLKSSYGNYYLKNNIPNIDCIMTWFLNICIQFYVFLRIQVKKKWCKNEEIFC